MKPWGAVASQYHMSCAAQKTQSYGPLTACNRSFWLSPVPFSFKSKKPQCPFSNSIVIPVAVEENGVVDRLLSASIHLMNRHSVCSCLCSHSNIGYSSSGRRRKMVSLEKDVDYARTKYGNLRFKRMEKQQRQIDNNLLTFSFFLMRIYHHELAIAAWYPCARSTASFLSHVKVLLSMKGREIYCLICCFIFVVINSHSSTKEKKKVRKPNLGQILEHFPQAGISEWHQRSSWASDAVHFLAWTNQTDDFIQTTACATSVWADPRLLACSAECECFKVGEVKRAVCGERCAEKRVFSWITSSDLISHWQSQTGSDRTPQMLMEGRGGMQAGLIAVWWSEVPQSQHHPPRLPQVDSSFYPTPAGLCHSVNAAII